MTAKPRRRIAAVLTAALLSGADLVATAPPAGAAHAPAAGYRVVTTTRWTSIAVFDAGFHRRLKPVRLTLAFGVGQVAVTVPTPVRPQLTPVAARPQDRDTVFVRVFEQ